MTKREYTIEEQKRLSELLIKARIDYWAKARRLNIADKYRRKIVDMLVDNLREKIEKEAVYSL